MKSVSKVGLGFFVAESTGNAHETVFGPTPTNETEAPLQQNENAVENVRPRRKPRLLVEEVVTTSRLLLLSSTSLMDFYETEVYKCTSDNFNNCRSVDTGLRPDRGNYCLGFVLRPLLQDRFHWKPGVCPRSWYLRSWYPRSSCLRSSRPRRRSAHRLPSMFTRLVHPTHLRNRFHWKCGVSASLSSTEPAEPRE